MFLFVIEFFSHNSRCEPAKPPKSKWQWSVMNVFYQFDADTYCWVKIDGNWGIKQILMNLLTLITL